ncbi:MAG: hypothetical protein RL636_1354, partial [Verrucomicrobiota bacterium]
FLRIDATDTWDGPDSAGGTGLNAFSLAHALRRGGRDGLGTFASLASGRGFLCNGFTTLAGSLGGLFDGLSALASGCGFLCNGFTTLAGSLGVLFDGFAALAGGRGRLFDGFAILTGRLGPLRHGLRTGGLSRLGNGLAALPHRLGGLLDGLTILRRRLDGLGDGLRLLRHRLRRLGLRGVDGLYARGTPLFDAFDAFDVRRGGVLGRSGGAKKTGGEEQAVHWERWVRTDFWNSISTRCSYSANAVSSWCSAR